MSTRRTRNPKFVQIGASDEIREYKASVFLILILIFFPDLPTKVTRGRILTQWPKTRGMTQGCAFLGFIQWQTTFWGSNFPQTVRHFWRFVGNLNPKMLSAIVWTPNRHVRVSANGFKMNDVIEDWRHWRLSVASSPWMVEWRILFIASLHFPIIKHNATKSFQLLSVSQISKIWPFWD